MARPSKSSSIPKAGKARTRFPASPAAAQALKVLPHFLLLDGPFRTETGRRFRRLLRWMAGEGGDPDKGRRRWGRLWRSLAEEAEFARHRRVGDMLQDHLLESLLEDPNPLHRKADLAPLSQVGGALAQAYLRELEAFRKIIRSDWESEYLKKAGADGAGAPSLKKAGKGTGAPPAFPALETRRMLKEEILSGGFQGQALLAEIAGHFYRNGWGLFGRYRAFRWETRGGEGALRGIEAVDPIRLEDLIGYDDQRRPLLDNIEAFTAGKGANNVLIYGERGTGKSSTVKALLNAYQDRGLRLVEVHAADLAGYPRILEILRGRPEKFVLFVDDLSFEENETSYKGLKALLEGTLEATPGNVILIATSNRRHLVREFFADRAGGLQEAGEIHGADTVEEKLSLADRFGLVVSFYAPSQETYLRIAEKWARTEGIRMPREDLRARAVQWEKSNNVRSGRTARQFVSDLKGKM
jgi:uncharacterized protein